MDVKYLKKAIKYQLIRNKLKKKNVFINTETDINDLPIIYIFFVACGTNMGDHAIVKAEFNFIRNCLGENVRIVEILTSQTESAIEKLRNELRPQDIIVFSGGGYIGDEYIEIYSPLKKILKLFKTNKTIIFPQTIFFSSNSRESRFVKLCKNHKNLNVFVREKRSLEIFSNYGVKSYLVPDIVLSQIPQKHGKREDIFLCMRNDVEKNLSDNSVRKLYELLKTFSKVKVTDTVIVKQFPLKERFDRLDNMLTDFSNCRLVVTDRIHGMIFSYLTNTPCLVFGNYNHKVESEYEWIKDSNNIYFIKNFDIEIIRNKIIELLNLDDEPNKALVDKFSQLEEILKADYEL